MTTSRFVLNRIAHSILVIALTYVFVWVILFLLPGDPILSRIENPQNPIPPNEAAKIISYYHLDLPWFQQFWLSVTRLFQGDLGYSLATGRPVIDLVTQGFASTAALAALALVLTIVLALVIALVAVFAPWAPVRSFFRALPVLALATPGFLIGLILLQIFAYQLGWVSSIRDEGFKSLILPAITLAIGVNAPIAQVLITGLSGAFAQPFVTVLRATGESERRIILGHVLKNGSIPAITLLGLTVGDLLAGSVIAEAIFSRSGLGFVTEQAVRAQDGPVVQAVVMIIAVIFTLVNLATDLIYPRIDPRISHPAATKPSRAARAAQAAPAPKEVTV